MKIAINLQTGQCVALIEITELDWHSMNSGLTGIVGIPVCWRDGLGALPKPDLGWVTGDFQINVPYLP